MDICEAPTKRNMMQNILHEWEKDWIMTEKHWAAREMKTTFFLPNLNGQELDVIDSKSWTLNGVFRRYDDSEIASKIWSRQDQNTIQFLIHKQSEI